MWRYVDRSTDPCERACFHQFYQQFNRISGDREFASADSLIAKIWKGYAPKFLGGVDIPPWHFHDLIPMLENDHAQTITTITKG